MDWSQIIVITLLVLDVCLHWFWKPYSKAYATESGREDAITDNLSRINTRLEQQTDIVERLKAEISDKFWDKQTKWTLKRDLYTRLLENLGEVATNSSNTATLLDVGAERSLSPADESALAELSSRVRQLQFEMARTTAVAVLAISSESIKILQTFGAATLSLNPHDPETPRRLTDVVTRTRDDLVEAARADLGFDPINLAS